jgi:putative ABC transport system permease protein
VLNLLPLGVRNLLRDKLRTILTGAAVALFAAMTSALLSLPDALAALLEDVTSKSRVVVHHKAGLSYRLPVAYLEKVRSLPGVVAAASWTWFGGTLERQRGVTFPSFAVDPEVLGTVWSEYGISEAALSSFREKRNGAIVGRGTLVRERWKVGDRVTLDSLVYDVRLEFLIVGEIPDERATHFWFQREYLGQVLESRPLAEPGISSIWLRAESPARASELGVEIDRLFSNSPEQTMSELEENYAAFRFGAIQKLGSLTLALSTLLFVCVAFISANSVSLSVTERRVELAVLRALGFPRRALWLSIAAESVVLSGLSGLLGCCAAAGLGGLLFEATVQRSFIGSFIAMTPGLVAACVGGCAAMGFFAAALPSYSLLREPLSEGLRV